MGEATFDEVVSIEPHLSPFHLVVGKFGYKRTIFDIDVHVVPNLEGIALIPKKIVEKEVPNDRRIDQHDSEQ
jgi:hypothetical protein